MPLSMRVRRPGGTRTSSPRGATQRDPHWEGLGQAPGAARARASPVCCPTFVPVPRKPPPAPNGSHSVQLAAQKREPRPESKGPWPRALGHPGPPGLQVSRPLGPCSTRGTPRPPTERRGFASVFEDHAGGTAGFLSVCQVTLVLGRGRGCLALTSPPDSSWEPSVCRLRSTLASP